MKIEDMVDTYLAAYCEASEGKRIQLVRSVWNSEGRLIDPPMAASGHQGISNQAAALLAQFPGHVFRRTTEVDAHHAYASFGWSLAGPDGQEVLQGRDFLSLDVDGKIMSVVGFFGPPRARSR
jgi:hypothetical protein